MRKILKKLHLYFALILCIPLVIQGLTGATMVFRNQISNFLLKQNHNFSEGDIADEALIVNTAKQQVPEDFSLKSVKIPNKKNIAAKVRFNKNDQPKERLEVLLDPVSLKILKVENPEDNFFHIIKKFHESLFIPGEIGENIVGIFGIVMLFMALSGVVLWWPKKGLLKRALTFKFSDKGKKFYRDLHGAIGFWFALPLLSTSITGIYLIFFKTKESSKLWHAIHDGSAVELYGQAVIFLTGFLPLLFAITGILMWMKKKNKIKEIS